VSHLLFLSDLEKHFCGELLTDPVSLGIYATDASLYQILPVAVAIPRNEEDAVTAVKIAADHKIPIIARGGGTGLAGQTIGQGMILDLSKHINKIFDFSEEEKSIWVQPGVVRDHLNTFLNPHGLHFAPDPATSSRANIGGMVANNSSGTRSIIYGKTVDHVLAIKLLLSDGTILNLQRKSQIEYGKTGNQKDREGQIYRGVASVIKANEDKIRENFPKVMRRVGGYNLDEFVDTADWNLSKLIVGSEGTLGIILAVKVNLEPLPAFKYVCLAHFEDMYEGIRTVASILPYGPSAVEIIDNTVIEFSRENLATKDSCQVIEGHPECVLFIEFFGDSQSAAHEKAAGIQAYLKKDGRAFAYPIFPEGKEYNDILNVRKKGLGLLLGMKSKRKPVAFIEDAAIPLENLPAYLQEVDAVCEKYGTTAIKYAHVSVGVIHMRPMLDMGDTDDIERFKGIAEETFLLVKKYKGALSGEHGDGLVRSSFNERFFGPEIYTAFKEVKKLFDPNNLMNPGKITDAPAIDQNLRYGAKYKEVPLKTLFHYRSSGGFHEEVHMCSGVGECRKTESGTMCPSFMATRDETHSTRGRANALRLAMSGQFEKKGLNSTEVRDVLDLCLSCKACKSECPSNVDMAKLKSEVWQIKYDGEGPTLRERMIRDGQKFARLFSGPLSAPINAVQGAKIFRWFLEKTAQIDRRRILPTYAPKKFTTWYRQNYTPPNQIDDHVILFVDTYINYHEPAAGIATIKLLNACNIHVEIADVGCCQRPKISNGFLRDAKKDGQILLDKLDPFFSTGKKVLICEPSCASALQFDLPDLLDDEAAGKKLVEKVQTVADYLAPILGSKNNFPVRLQCMQILLHGHCHEKALYGTASIKKIFANAGATVQEIDSGCCGMAGSFGYEKEHYDLSEKISERRLIPAIKETSKNTMIVANGFSCRHQIEHFGNRKAMFWTEVFDL